MKNPMIRNSKPGRSPYYSDVVFHQFNRLAPASGWWDLNADTWLPEIDQARFNLHRHHAS